MRVAVARNVALLALMFAASCSDVSTVCPGADAAAQVVSLATPFYPPIAAEQGIGGNVMVVVSLDAGSNLIAAVIAKSPSALLNAAALSAARQSRYRTAVVNCRAVSATLTIAIPFNNPPKIVFP